MSAAGSRQTGHTARRPVHPAAFAAPRQTAFRVPGHLGRRPTCGLREPVRQPAPQHPPHGHAYRWLPSSAPARQASQSPSQPPIDLSTCRPAPWLIFFPTPTDRSPTSTQMVVPSPAPGERPRRLPFGLPTDAGRPHEPFVAATPRDARAPPSPSPARPPATKR